MAHSAGTKNPLSILTSRTENEMMLLWKNWSSVCAIEEPSTPCERKQLLRVTNGEQARNDHQGGRYSTFRWLRFSPGREFSEPLGLRKGHDDGYPMVQGHVVVGPSRRT